MPNGHPPSPLEFRADAMRLIRSGGRTTEQPESDLGGSAQAILTRVRHRAAGGPGGSGRRPLAETR